MMKRFFLSLALVICPVIAFAQSVDHDTLLTADGTLYTIESVDAQSVPTANAQSSQLLTLTVQQADQVATTVVPESLLAGSHSSPALAYDSDSKTLFIFWEHGINNHLSSDLVFCTYQTGAFSPATSIGSGDSLHRNHNLVIGVTRVIEQDDSKEGTSTEVAELNVHAIWWNESAYSQNARYAMLTVQHGVVTDIQQRDMTQFLDNSTDQTFPTVASVSSDLLTHPQVFESTAHDTVDVVFGDLIRNGFHRVTIKPTIRIAVDGRLRVPIGVKDHGFPGPNFRTQADSRVSSISSGDNLVFYFSGAVASGLQYTLFKNNAWSPLRTIALNDRLTRDGAVEALRRMASAE